MRKLFILILLFFFSCYTPDKPILYEKKKLPTMNEFILFSMEMNHDDQIKNKVSGRPVFFLLPDEKKFYLADLDFVTNEKQRPIFNYVDFLIYPNSKMEVVLPLEEKKKYKKYLSHYPYPAVNANFTEFIYPERGISLGIYKTDGSLKKTLPLNLYINTYGWLNDTNIYFLDNHEDAEPKGTYRTRKNNHKIYKYNLLTNQKQMIYDSSSSRIVLVNPEIHSNRIALVEYSDDRYTLKIISMENNKTLFSKIGYGFIKRIHWSRQGELGLVHDAGYSEFPHYTISIVSKEYILKEILNLPPATDSPGFFYGDGYKGVVDFDWSSDGKNIVYIASEAKGCSLADEGGNVRCKNDIYKIQLDSGTKEKLTEFQREGFVLIKWISQRPNNLP